MSFFEGSEKKVEITIKAGEESLLKLDDSFFKTLVHSCNAEILSTIKNDNVTAYLLSESSLFIFDNRILMITCGQTVMINSVLKFIELFGKNKIDSLIFQRKNEYISSLQKSSFYEDLELLKNEFDGKSYRLGNLDGHHNFLYHIDSNFQASKDDSTTELLMYHIEGDAAKIFQSDNTKIEEIRELLKLETIFKDFLIDDYLFTPYGYSLNGIKDDQYFTIHVTPQNNNSYVSFETNINQNENLKEILGHIIKTLKPYTFDVISFNSQIDYNFFDSFYKEISCVKENLECGYVVLFKQLSKIGSEIKRAVQIS